MFNAIEKLKILRNRLQDSGPWLPVLLLALLLFLHVAINLWWIVNDQHLYCYDEMWHVNHTRNYVNALSAARDKGIVPAIISVTRTYSWFYPPLLYYFGMIPPVLGWNTLDGLSTTNTAVFVFYILGMYLLARSFTDRWRSLLVAFVASLVPSLFAISRLHLTDLISATLVVYAMFALARSNRFTNPRWVFIFAIFNGLGFLSRQFTFVFYLLPSAIAFGAGLYHALGIGRGRTLDKEAIKDLILNAAMTIVVTVGIAAPWYLLHLDNIYEFSQGYQERWASRAPDRDYSMFSAVFFRTINDGVFLPAFIMGIAGTVLCFLRRRLLNWPIALVLFWLIGGILIKILCPWTGVAPRHLLPLYPAFVIPVVLLLLAPRRPLLRRTLVASYCALLVFQFVNLTFFSFGPIGELKVPVFTKHPMIEWSHDGGLIVYSDLIFASGAMYHAAQRDENWAERVLHEIVNRETEVQYTGTVEGNIQALRIDKTYIEFIQAESWPGANPLHEQPGHLIGVSPPCVPIHPETGPVRSRAVQTDTGTYCVEHEYPLYSSMIAWDYGNVPQYTVPFRSGAAIDSFTLAFSDLPSAPWEYTVQYRDVSGGKLLEFSPPVHWRGPRRVCHLHRFEPVHPAELVFTVLETPPLGNTARCDVAFFQNVRQQRPPKIAGFNEYHYGPGKLDPAQLDRMTYVIAQDDLEPEYLSYLADFDRIDEFTINGEGRPGHFFDDHIVRLFARKQAPLLTYQTSPHYRAYVTSDLHPNGRWDLPFWRWNDRNFPVNPRDEKGAIQYSWTSRLPAILDIELGSLHEIRGAALVPHTQEYGLMRAQGQYWDGAQGAWADLGDERPFLLSPYHQKDAQVHHTPDMWPSPVATDRLRFILLEGAAGAPAVGYLHNVFVYGSPAAVEYADQKAPEDVADLAFHREALRIHGPSVELAGKKDLIFAVPPSQISRGTTCLEFAASSMDDGTVTLHVNDKLALVFSNGSRESACWANGEFVLAFRPGAFSEGLQEGRYRLMLPESSEKWPGAEGLNIRFAFTPGTPDSSFTVLPEESDPKTHTSRKDPPPRAPVASR